MERRRTFTEWLYLHVPVSILLIALLIVHLYAVLYY